MSIPNNSRVRSILYPSLPADIEAHTAYALLAERNYPAEYGKAGSVQYLAVEQLIVQIEAAPDASKAEHIEAALDCVELLPYGPGKFWRTTTRGGKTVRETREATMRHVYSFAAGVAGVEQKPDLEAEPTEAPEPRPVAKVEKPNPAREFAAWVKDIVHPEVERREANGEPMASVGYKWIADGIGHAANGCPVHALQTSCVLDWSKSAREAVGVPTDFDFGKFGYIEYLKRLCATVNPQGRPTAIMLVGASQIGKSFLVEQLAAELKLPFAAKPMTAGLSIAEFKGRQTASGYDESSLVKVIRGGGVFNADEADASDSNTFLGLNSLLANGYMDAVDGMVRIGDKQVVVVANVNTLCHGAEGGYDGREAMDQATVNRFVPGRVLVKRCPKVEQQIADKLFAEYGV